MKLIVTDSVRNKHTSQTEDVTNFRFQCDRKLSLAVKFVEKKYSVTVVCVEALNFSQVPDAPSQKKTRHSRLLFREKQHSYGLKNCERLRREEITLLRE